MSNKEKGNLINSLLNVVIVVLIIAASIFSVFFIKSNLIFASDKTYPSVSVGQNDASTEYDFDKEYIFTELAGNDFHLSLDKNGNYILLSKDKSSQFIGKYQMKSGQEAISMLGEKNIREMGLNPKKININNLYIIKANYNEHLLTDGVEYYNSDIHDPDDNAFYFAIYLKQGDNKQILSAVHAITNIDEVEFKSSYF